MTTEEELRLWVAIWKQVAEEEAMTRAFREDEIVDMQISFQRMHRRAQKAEAKLIKLAKGSALPAINPADIRKAVEDMKKIGDRMAASIEGNYYLPNVAKSWRTACATLVQLGETK
jgi:hypothetical protein